MRRLWRHVPPADKLLAVLLALMLAGTFGNIAILLAAPGLCDNINAIAATRTG